MGAWWLSAIGTLITGFCYGLQKYLDYKGHKLPKHVAYYNEGAAYYFKTFLVFLFIRSFVVEWAVSPSEALKPTLLVGDRIITDKAAYGIRLPITGHLLVPLAKPKRGEIIVFRSPGKPSGGLVNRVVGLPGDKIEYRNKKLTINEKALPQKELGIIYDEEAEEDATPFLLFEEKLEGQVYQICTQYNAVNESKQSIENNKPISIVVPPKHYFVIGDNRDNSIDSRSFGCVPERNLLGQAKRIYLSRKKPTTWWKLHTWIRWTRLGKRVHINQKALTKEWRLPHWLSWKRSS